MEAFVDVPINERLVVLVAVFGFPEGMSANDIIMVRGENSME